ncbi:glycosyltransferase family 2 protein [Sedimentimonas flavescens]|nr:glycosyltransferase family 2 protein [Sedimentimonas flavescens]
MLLFGEMCSVSAGGVTLLDAVERPVDDGTRRVSLYFAAGTDVAQIGFGPGVELLSTAWVMSAPVLQVRIAEGAPLECVFGAVRLRVTPFRPDLGLLRGKNTFAAVRNGESAETIVDWLAYHTATQGLDGAVILDRSPPGEDTAFDAALEGALAESALVVMLLRAPLPLGKRSQPPEQHPYCAPESPGRDRMDLPEPDPWRAPLGEVICYEIMRQRYLGQARAVANIEVHDLLEAPEGRSVFDAAVAADTGVVALTGRSAYPWRVRAGDPISFGDHICVQFDASKVWNRWCIAPSKASPQAVWRMTRVGNAAADPRVPAWRFHRCMNLRHPVETIASIVPRAALIEDAQLLALAEDAFEHRPIRMPAPEASSAPGKTGRRAIVTTMKNEGPFILEWLAYHRAIGFDDFLIYTNDCTDGTDSFLSLLERKGLVQHRDNPFRAMDMRPQHAALAVAPDEPVIGKAAWVACIDVDEFINIKVGDGTLDALFAAVPDANLISMTWRLFGNADVADFNDAFVTQQFTRCAPEFTPKPHQAWGFKTLFANVGIFRKLGVHRPKGFSAQKLDKIHWVNGSGRPLPESEYRGAWRSNAQTYGYDLVQLNHYAVRSAESFLVKRDRGRVNHVERDQGLAYWFRMNNNAQEDLSIQRALPKAQGEMRRLLADPEIAAAHAECVAAHRAKITELRADPGYGAFFDEITSQKMQRLSRLHGHFGANVFLAGPTCIPDEIAAKDPAERFFFTVERQETVHS